MPTNAEIMRQLREEAAEQKKRDQQQKLRQHASQARLAATGDAMSKQDAVSDRAWRGIMEYIDKTMLNPEQTTLHDWRACMSMILASAIHLNEAVAESFKYKLYELGSLIESNLSEPLLVPVTHKITDALTSAIKEKLSMNKPLILDDVFHDVSIDNQGKLSVNLKFGKAEASKDAKQLFKIGVEQWLLSQGYHITDDCYFNDRNERLNNVKFKELMKNPDTGFSAALEGRFDLYHHLHPQETPVPGM